MIPMVSEAPRGVGTLYSSSTSSTSVSGGAAGRDRSECNATYSSGCEQGTREDHLDQPAFHLVGHSRVEDRVEVRKRENDQRQENDPAGGNQQVLAHVHQWLRECLSYAHCPK